MASVYHRHGSKFYYAAYHDSTGKRHYRSTKKTRKAEALRVATEMEARARRVSDTPEDTRRVLAILEEAGDRALRGNLNTASARLLLNRILEVSGNAPLYDPTVEEWFNNWLGDKKGSRTEATWLRYKGVVDAFLESLPKKRLDATLGSLTIDDVRTFRDRLVSEGRSPSTANVALKTLRSPLSAARKQGLILHNPAEGVELLAPQAAEKEVFTPEQVASLVRHGTGEWKGLILAGYYTGGRIGDLSNLDWAAVDLGGGVIRFTQGKTKRRVEVPVHSELKKFLLKTPKSKRKGPVFPALAGKTSAGRNGLSGQFRRIMKKADIEGTTTERSGDMGRNRSSLTFHSLRHSFNSAMANTGVTQEIRQRLTGHASKSVNDAYTHAELETLRTAVDAVPALPAKKKKPAPRGS